MNANRNILVAVDDSEASDRAVTYVADIVHGRKEFKVVLFHVPASMPPRLLEFGGAEHPADEEKAEATLSAARSTWVEEAERAAEPIFARAVRRLSEAHMTEEALTTQVFMPPGEQSLDTTILEAARAHECRTVVVGREAFSWVRELFQAHVANKLMAQADDLTLWIVL
jgi:nucleotide-binding universal stress UspA family protein